MDGKPQPKDTGSGSAFLVRVRERRFPSAYEFSPREYVTWLHTDVFGDIMSRRARVPLKEMPGRLNQAVANWFSNFDWLKKKFKIETNAPLETDRNKQ